VTVARVIYPRMTPAEFVAAMWRTGWRAPIELIDGQAVVIPPAGGDASFAKTQLVHGLCAWQEAEGRAGRVLADVFVRLQDAFLAPDVAWWGAGREPRIEPGAIDTVPDVVVEVLSPRTRDNDLGPKRGRYLGAGVRELWLIDPADRSAVIATASGEKRLRAPEELTSPLLPGFRMPLSDLLA
jgi:Uma2 family endonuclease